MGRVIIEKAGEDLSRLDITGSQMVTCTEMAQNYSALILK
jgi:hypothetical protein